MRFSIPAFLVIGLSPMSCAASPARPPDFIARMVEAAMATGDPATVKAVVSTALKVAPERAKDIQALEASFDRGKAQGAQSVGGSAVAPKGWASEAELGGDRTTGSSDTLGVHAALKPRRASPRWSQDLSARVDYQRGAGATTVDHVLVGYKPQLTLSPDLYAYGLGQYEHDRPLGYDTRYVVGLGVGWRHAGGKRASFALDAGPSVRRTDYDLLGPRNRVAARASLHFKWALTDNLTLATEDAVFFERGNTTASSTSSLDTRLFGPLKTRFSYNIEFESDAPGRERKLDTISRVSLVYSH